MAKLIIKMTQEASDANLSEECKDLAEACKKLNAWIFSHTYGFSSVRKMQYDGKNLSWNGRIYDGKIIA